MQHIIGFVNFAAVVGLVSILGYRTLLFWADQFGYANNLQVKAKLQQLGFLYKLLTKPSVAVAAVIAVVLLNIIAYFID